MDEITARNALSDALRYWEPRRIVFNAALAIEVVAIYLAHLPVARIRLDLNLGLMIFVLAVLANVAYCAAYLVDVPVQLTAFRQSWRRYRWCLALVGTGFAGALTYFFASGFVSAGV